jgi:hypothetical protein
MTPLVLITAVVTLLAPPAAAPTKADVLSSWTQATSASTNSWNAARVNRTPYASYQFDWSTDYCSDSPDKPLGFDFTLSCWHHDFGYRNYKAIGQFPANKARVDTMFYADLKRKCATYSAIVRPACLSLAWTYYSAVDVFGSVSAVDPAGIRAAAQLKREALEER